MASDPVLVGGAKSKILEQLQSYNFLYSNMKTYWADSWPVITQCFDLDLLVM